MGETVLAGTAGDGLTASEAMQPAKPVTETTPKAKYSRSSRDGPERGNTADRSRSRRRASSMTLPPIVLRCSRAYAFPAGTARDLRQTTQGAKTILPVRGARVIRAAGTLAPARDWQAA